MVEHIVLFKLKAETTESEKERLISELGSLKGRTPGMADLSVGETFTDRHQGFTVGLVVRFKDKASLEAYGPHPAHVPVKELAGSLSDSVIAVDYEF